MLKRLQHDGFGKEIRQLIASPRSEEKQIAGIVIEELDALMTARRAVASHPNEERLTGDDLRDVQYLKLRRGGNSIRVYFTTIGNHIWMLALDHAKRRTDITDAVKERLIGRLREARQQDDALRDQETANQGGR